MATKRLAERLVDHGNEVFIIAPSPTYRNVILNENGVTVFGIKSLPIPFYKFARYVPYYFTKNDVFRIMREINPDVVHIQTFLSIAKSAASFAKKNRLPTVATGHFVADVLSFELRVPKLITKTLDNLVWKYSSQIWSEADILTSPSQWAGEYYSKRIGPGKDVFHISNGLGLEDFSHKVVAKRIQLMILYVGRLDPIKNVGTIISALPAILKDQKAKLVLAGEGVEEESLKKLANDLGVEENVTFLGFVSQKKVRNLLKKAGVFVSASSLESQGIAILEATASGLPIVATKVGGVPELVKDGRNGYLFKPGDSASLAKKVLKILQNKKLAGQMGRESIKIAAKHDIEGVVSEFEYLYQKAIAINSLKVTNIQPKPFFISRGLVVKMAFAILLLAILFKNSLTFPAIAKAKGMYLRNRIESFKVVKEIKSLDEKFITTLQESK